jgi:hypothetical protein
MGVPTGWRKHQQILRRGEVHRPLGGHPHWFSEPVGQIEFGGDRFLLVLEPGDGGPLRHAPTLSTGPLQRAPRPPVRGEIREDCYHLSSPTHQRPRISRHDDQRGSVAPLTSARTHETRQRTVEAERLAVVGCELRGVTVRRAGRYDSSLFFACVNSSGVINPFSES